MIGEDITVEQLGKQLGIGRNNLYHFLRTCGVLRKNNLPQTRFKGLGLFKLLPHKIETGNDEIITHQTLFTPKGAAWFREKIDFLICEMQSIDPLNKQGRKIL